MSRSIRNCCGEYMYTLVSSVHTYCTLIDAENLVSRCASVSKEVVVVDGTRDFLAMQALTGAISHTRNLEEV